MNRTASTFLRMSGNLASRMLGLAILLVLLSGAASAQLDQGTIAGIVTDTTGGVIPNAQVTLTSGDTGLVLHSKTTGAGEFVFSPIKIGNYSLTVAADGMQTTTQQNLHVDLQQRLSVPIALRPGSVSETVTITDAPPLLQTEQASVGQVISTTAINNTPLNGRNFVYIAQLTAGVTPTPTSRGGGTGDFNANGQRSQQNNFLLDGVDNNINIVDFLNGASYVVRPPPDALAEFKVETTNYNAEFGHSAGAVMNVSLKSGTNDVHGSLWEYFRNDILDARDFNSTTVPKYRQNQFGATLGTPIIRNKLFFFGDVEANRIIFGETNTATVPTALMRQGNFSELLDPTLTATGNVITLYQPGSGGKTPLACNGQKNVFCQPQLDTIAQKLVNLYPLPNANGAKAYNNYVVNRNVRDNTFQFDVRADYNISTKDQTFARFSYSHEPQYRPSPLGYPLDGGAFQDNGIISNLGENFAFSETHIFTPNLVNEFRFGYNYGSYSMLQPYAASNVAADLGLGGLPLAAGTGGLPALNITGQATAGTINYFPTKEGENTYQLLDNVTRIIGKHSLKFGVNYQNIRFRTLQVASPLGSYSYTGLYTSNLGATNTGYGLADFLTNQMNSATLSSLSQINDDRLYRAAYAQDDWRATPKLTLNLGLRYEFVQPYRENTGRQANFISNPTGVGTGTGTFLLPSSQQNTALSTNFRSALAANNITIAYSDKPALVDAQKANFAPRVGFSYAVSDKTVVRSGFGMFFGGLENRGGATNLGANFPFQFSSTFPSGGCNATACAGNGITLETGFASAIAAGLQNSVTTPLLVGYDTHLKTPYTYEQNLTIEHSITNDIAASVAYVSSMTRHLQVPLHPNAPEAITNNANAVTTLRPFPLFGDGQKTSAIADSNYNSLQTKLEKRFSHGNNFLATYTWSHSLDDAPSALTADTVYPNTNLVPIQYSYSSSVFDVRHRFTLNGYYQIPFGKGQKYFNHGGVTDVLLGGFASALTFIVQTGEPFTVSPANISTAAGINAYAIPVGDPFRAGGSPDPTNPTIACATKTRTLTHWYNPCAFANPLNGNAIPKTGTGSQITALPQVLQYVGGRRNSVTGPGLTRVNLSLFKNITVFREQKLQLRADGFNMLNTPAYGAPSTANDSSNGGLITGSRSLQNLTPDARFFQLAAKYIF